MEQQNKATPCECPMAGFCERHGVNKSAHLHKLCQNHIGYFVMWEDCQGPNQSPVDCTRRSSSSNETNFVAPAQNSQNMLQMPPREEKVEPKLPSTLEMARNFLGSATDYVKNGMKNVTEDEQKARLAICQECPHMVEGGRCGKCGCFLQTKTKWASSSCPIGKW